MLIYKITNTVNGKIYVGKWHGKSAKSRWAMHVAHAKSFTSGKKHYFHSAIRKHGPSAFVIEEIATPENVAKMGATRKGSHNSPEHCEAISRGVSGQKNGMYGKTPWLGKQHTQASRKKMSTTRKEMYASDSSLSVRISEEMKRNWGNPKVRRKMLAGARRGSKMSSMTQFGHPVSEETKRKISEAAKARHAARKQASA